ncbi:hypothetical protein TCDM_12009 [Trypanosoma cruzi Dm28c]|uniref:Uncharacterized protein n=1 Tax=Trypanosoma cruzi Dm28c TaxID=1416333 RepID=V5B3C8_TRYCR|nr:hypothetical protein TCDM_12009 [Trypanosoma cruzi Dm28c]
MHRGHPRRNQRQQNKQCHTHSRNGPAPQAVPAARTRTHRRPHPPTQPGINRTVVVCRTRLVDRASCSANHFLQMSNTVTRFRQIVIPLLLLLIILLLLRVITKALKR